MPYPGEILNGVYQIVDEIGKGGVGIIYRAWHLNLQKYVVVKKIKDHYVDALEVRGEVDILKSLHHSCLPQVYDFLQVNHEVYTVMDFIDGHDLKYYIDNGYQFDEATLWHWLEKLCEVLEYLHEHQILHMDIKPANIMLTEEGNIYLIDFNISLSGEEDAISGVSEFYASPEQYRKFQAAYYGFKDQEGPLTAGTDIYSLGATFYHLMTGVMPCADREGLRAISEFEVPYSYELVKIIDKMMLPEKKRRFQSVSKIRDVIKRMQRTEEEEKTLRIVFLGMLTGIVILLTAMGILYFKSQYGGTKKEHQMLVEEEYKIEQFCSQGEYETAYNEALYYMNDNARMFEKIEGSTQSFLEIMVDCCIGMEIYEDALEYLNELLKIEIKQEYYANAAVASAYMGKYADAEMYLQYAKNLAGNQEELDETLAEIKASKGEYQEAIKIYQSLQQKTNSNSVQRRIAVLALKASDTQLEYAQLAIQSYENLEENGTAFYTDKMNLVSAYLKCNMNEKALSVLQEMEVLYPEKYEPFLRAAILRYNLELKKAPSERNFAKTRKEAEKAIQLYEMFSSEKIDDEIEMLKQLLELLT